MAIKENADNQQTDNLFVFPNPATNEFIVALSIQMIPAIVLMHLPWIWIIFVKKIMQTNLPKSSENIKPILSSFKDRARRIYGNKLKKVILYGSYAKGVAKQDSDIDLMIVLSEMESPFAEIERLTDIKFSIGLEHDIFISTNPVSEDSFSHSNLPIFKNVLREGIEV